MRVHVEIVSPSRRHLDRKVSMVVVPGTEGDIAAMPGHAPVMLQLRGGVVSVYAEGEQTPNRLFVSGGFVDIAGNHCTILADSVRELNELSRQDAQKRLGELEAQRVDVENLGNQEREALEYQIQSVQAELETIESIQPITH